VLEWSGQRLREILTDSPWYYRVIGNRRGNLRLLGQKRGMTRSETAFELEGARQLFSGPVTELVWRGNRYEPAGPFPLSRELNIFGFSAGDARNDGSETVVAVNRNDRLVVYGPGNNSLWRSRDRFGGSMTYFEYRTSTQFTADERYYLPQRVVIGDVDGDGRNEVMLVQNRDLARNLTARFRKFTHGQVAVLEWDGVAMNPEWHTREVSDYVSDLTLLEWPADGMPAVVYAVVTASGLMEKPRSYLAAWRPEQQQL